MYLIIIVLVCVSSEHSFAQENIPPKYETRAVWLTTLLGLDWPSSALVNDQTAQQQSLREKLDNIEKLNLNTVMFQVRSRGNAFYESSIEPYAAELTGVLGKDPGWDPLQFTIDETHERGLELHAWVNIFRVWTGENSPPRSTIPHVARAHPDWGKEFRNELWLDPGIPGVRRYVVDICIDIARRYDIDGIHLDYIRYPDAGFDDGDTYRKYGNGKPKSEWRRENVNKVVEEIYRAVTSIKPWIKVGSAPIGIYENLPTAKGWQAYHNLFQDSRRWLREGYHDYIAPQVYWGLRSHGSAIDFAALAADWKKNASERHVYIGMAAYRSEVAKYLYDEIDVTREVHAEGQCFFRYEFITDPNIFKNRYQSKTLVPSMSWKSQIPPMPPRTLFVQSIISGQTKVTWGTNSSGYADADDDRIVLYRSKTSPVDVTSAENIVGVFPLRRGSYMDRTENGKFYYAATTLNRFNIESAATQEVRAIAFPEIVHELLGENNSVSENIEVEGKDVTLIGFTTAQEGHVRLRLVNKEGNEIASLVDEKRNAGMYIVGIIHSSISSEIDLYIFEAEEYRVVRKFNKKSR